MSDGQTNNAALTTALAFHYQALVGVEKCSERNSRVTYKISTLLFFVKNTTFKVIRPYGTRFISNGIQVNT